MALTEAYDERQPSTNNTVALLNNATIYNKSSSQTAAFTTVAAATECNIM